MLVPASLLRLSGIPHTVINMKTKLITVKLEVKNNVPVDEKTGDSKNYEGQSRPNCHYSKDRKMICRIQITIVKKKLIQ